MAEVRGKLSESDSEERKESKKMREEMKKKIRQERKKEREDQEILEVEKLEEKKEAMRTAADVIKRISWDEFLTREKRQFFTVGYLDRFKGVVEESFESFNWQDDLASLGPLELAIPQHRIQYFKYKDITIWDKNSKIDLVFGSCGRTTKFEEFIAKN